MKNMDIPRPLPPGWRWVRLGEVCERVDYGYTASADFTVTEPRFLRITDIQDGKVNWDSVPGCRISIRETEVNALSDGDIVFARTGGTTGKSFLIRDPPPSVFASYLIRLRVKREVDAEYLYAFFQSDGYWRQIRTNARGGAQPNVNATLLSNLDLPLPPLPEQRRIAAILTEQMAAVERARNAAEEQLAAAKALPAAYLRTVFNSEEAKRWERKSFGDLVENFDGRRVPVKVDDRRGRKGPYPYYGASGAIDFVDEYLFDGDYLLISEDGANLLLRSTPIAFRANGKFWVNNHAHVVQPKYGISLDYLLHLLEATDLEPYINGSAQPKLTQKELNSIPTPLPSFPTQSRVAAMLTDQMAQAEKVRKGLEEQLDGLNKLPAALLRRAFSGEL